LNEEDQKKALGEEWERIIPDYTHTQRKNPLQISTTSHCKQRTADMALTQFGGTRDRFVHIYN
jgi:hypothetical protein